MKHHFWKENGDKIVVGLLIAVGAVLAYFVCLKISSLWAITKGIGDIIAPVISGAFIAYLVSPMCNAYENGAYKLLNKFHAFKTDDARRRLSATVGVAGSMITLVAAVALFFVMILPQVWTSIVSMVSSISVYTDNIVRLTRDLFAEYPELGASVTAFWESAETYVTNFFQQTILPNIDKWVTSLTGGVGRTLSFLYNLIIGVIVAIYMLSSRKQFAAQGTKILYAVLPVRHAGALLGYIRYADRVFGRFIGGTIVDSVFVGIISMIGLRLMNMPYAVLMSVIIGVTNIVPFFGAIAGGVICVFITLSVDPLKALYLGIFILLMQQIDGNIISPRILGESTGLSSFWVLFSILLFGGLWGVVGMVIGVPLFAVIYSMVNDWVNSRLKAKNLSTQTMNYRDVDVSDMDDGNYLD